MASQKPPKPPPPPPERAPVPPAPGAQTAAEHMSDVLGQSLPPIPPPEGLRVPPIVATPPLATQLSGRRPEFVDGYDLSGWYVSDATPEEGAAALRAAGITPGEFNAPDWETRPVIGRPPRSRFLFQRGEDGVIVAWRADDGTFPVPDGAVPGFVPVEEARLLDEAGGVVAT